MIPRTSARGQRESWRQSLRQAITHPAELLAALDLPPGLLGEGAALAAGPFGQGGFPLRVPRGFVARMRKGDPTDPLLLQVLPRAVEMEPVPGFGSDPLAEMAAAPIPGLLHKYHGRALLVVTGVCAVHCRYCFRRHFPYEEQHAGARPGSPRFEAALRYLRNDPTIEEVLLSGGDPLSLPDEQLAELVAVLEEIPHLRRLRIHTRTAVVLPERVDSALLGWLGGTRLRTVVVLHVNHAREVDPALGPEVVEACARLAGAGATLLNQSVLLRGVNDSVEALAELSDRLFAAGVLPYYLHLLDRVAGAAHFEVEEDEARRLMRQLVARLPGYLVPKLVREVPGAPGKVGLPG